MLNSGRGGMKSRSMKQHLAVRTASSLWFLEESLPAEAVRSDTLGSNATF